MTAGGSSFDMRGEIIQFRPWCKRQECSLVILDETFKGTLHGVALNGLARWYC